MTKSISEKENKAIGKDELSINRFSDIGKIHVNWDIKELGYFLDYFQPTDFISEYVESEKSEINNIPVLTAGKSFILGYTENNNKTYTRIPVILFDDFTTDSKYVDFPFQIRSSAAKILIAKKNIDFDFKFVFYAMQQINFVSSDHKRYWISEYQFLTIPCPPFKEQELIAKALNTWDIAINLCKTILAELQRRKEWLLFELLFNNQKYFKSNEIKSLPVSKLLRRIKRPLTPNPLELYTQIGIRSHTKGIFYKEAVTGASLGNKSVFYIEPDCFILNIVFAWEHAIAKTSVREVGMIASHRFPMYKAIEGELDLNYLLHFFKSKKGKDLLRLASPGGAGRNKTLGQSEFLKLQIRVPGIDEQKKIAACLDKVDEEILLYEKKFSELKNQRKGLMQQLLTAKIRVKYEG
ncbi:MAG: hypothetical protein JWR61_2906 [Ferruginibacter sp.]|uniref:restriction endonuclease subunit S n=1 Tax=Ferruginibacter sp. TaxID=1940288 RepID=UPI00265B481B|nr:restriction endonuclease subunit S [Ferruginibacter sp.]MDB5277951.1 hypothetical protein [Ferruginibacter sp.]